MLGPFWNLFERYCEDLKHPVTVPLVFAILYWSKSVIYLQGNAFIKRALSITEANLHQIDKRLDRVHTKGKIQYLYSSNKTIIYMFILEYLLLISILLQ